MEKKNVSSITTVHLLGFQTPHNITIFIFLLFIMIYCVTICGNVLIITLVSFSESLQSPMYFFLSQLSVTDILLSTDILPNMLHVKETTISFSDCMSQFYFFCVLETSECLLLTLMCYDRYLAICKPLHYNVTMNTQFCWVMIITCWVFSFLLVLVLPLTISQLKFCGPNIVDHFFCDLYPILQLSCSDTTNILLQVTLLDFIFGVIPFFIIIVSYVYIIITIFKIPTVTGRQKVFSTCSSHFIVVGIYYGALISVYLVPSIGQTWNIGKFLSLMYTVVTPLVNPIIYNLRNKDLKKAAAKITINCLNWHFSK
ncbi:olfactory receptor 11L1-like [Pyxicephalus adspersus]|uniref:Olfactory receptor n=1 Tax=Pyxicephalus adspersus TaxID=30357 RepID=A0AAV3AKN0_PYXAD|nr:TPA: hypothetical protein GDO54_005846 [Pyxicephalus adspersus]